MEGRAAPRVVIVGGGTAGWMAAALLSRVLLPAGARILLVESPEQARIGVGEATVPPLVAFLERAGIPERDFLLASNGSFKLGIRFDGWHPEHPRAWHPFGRFGGEIDGVAVFHHWHRCVLEGLPVGGLHEYSLQATLAASNRGLEPGDRSSPVGMHRAFAYHLDADAFAQLLEGVARSRGVEHRRAAVVGVERDHRGHVTALHTESGPTIQGDLFLDCTGFAARLIGHELGAPWRDQSHRLLCDRALALALPRDEALPSYTRATALGSGWVWRVPLSHRTGCGYVYSSAFASEDQAAGQLLDHLSANEPGFRAGHAELRPLQIRVGWRPEAWQANVVGVGLAAGFLEPLESTGLFLVQRAIELLIEHLPDGPTLPAQRSAFNRRMDTTYEELRDFLLLHYALAGRGEAFWQASREAASSRGLLEALARYDATGLVEWGHRALFGDTSFHAVAAGLGRLPRNVLPRARLSPAGEVCEVLERIRAQNRAQVGSFGDHRAQIDALYASAPAASSPEMGSASGTSTSASQPNRRT